MNQNFLLTYTNNDGLYCYDWFLTEEDLKDFINGNKETIREINDAIEICQAREIEL